MTANLLYPAYPVRLVDSSQLLGLEDGEFFCQPLWRGRRIMRLANGQFYWPNGRLMQRRPRGFLWLPRALLSLELKEGKGGQLRVLDVLIARPLEERRRLAGAYGMELHATRVRSADEVNQKLLRWMETGQCSGVVLKRATAPYPWLPHAAGRNPHWLEVREGIAREKAQ